MGYMSEVRRVKDSIFCITYICGGATFNYATYYSDVSLGKSAEILWRLMAQFGYQTRQGCGIMNS